VSAGLYRFTVVGTAFTVSQTRSRLELVVSEGTVAVWRGTKRLATVGAGAEWAVEVNPAACARVQAPRAQPSSTVALIEPPTAETGALAPPPVSAPAAAIAGAAFRVTATALTPPPAPPATAVASAYPERAATPAAVRRDCGQLAASKRAQEALTCYQDQAAHNGLAGETAQYELARLWRDSLGDLDRALAAFQAQRSRFPNGVLRTEADLSIIELLPRLDRHAEALAESEQFLTAHPKAERSGEIHLLRGNIFREVLRDLDHAEREYALGAGARGRVGDDNRFMHAVCLEALGRTDDARKSYEAYLLHSGATHVQEAKRRLEGLHP
jgi:tetratricopeptide (TPR) repeat protein